MILARLRLHYPGGGVFEDYAVEIVVEESGGKLWLRHAGAAQVAGKRVLGLREGVTSIEIEEP